MTISNKYMGIAALAVWAAPGLALDLPSGIQAELSEVLVEQIDAENWIRFRFVAPEIDKTMATAPNFADLEEDFPTICSKLALPYLSEHALSADTIVISLSDRFVEFGTTDPDATQYFEQFRLESGLCIWEGI